MQLGNRRKHDLVSDLVRQLGVEPIREFDPVQFDVVHHRGRYAESLGDVDAGLMMAALQTIQANLAGRDCFAERVEASLRECRETIKHAQDAGVSPLYLGDYLYS